ncbi:MAG: GntR family transcriptional regulator [Pikeienuella sp.]
MKATYREIRADLLRRIQAGEWAPGGLLPGELDLAESYGAARATVSRAMRELVEEGIVERKRKAGTRVRPSPKRQARFEIPLVRAEVEEQGAAYRYALVRSEILTPPDWRRARMNLPAGAEALHLVCMHYADGQPWQLEDRWINLEATPAAREADFTASGPNEWLVRQVPFSEVEIGFLAVSADERQARHLGCARGDALFQVQRRTTWREQMVTWVELTYRRDYRMTTRY